jgi:rhodanese-related sulfurtransferase
VQPHDQSSERLAHIPVEESLELLRRSWQDSRFRLLDVRTPEEYTDHHIAGAALMNCYELDFLAQLEALPRENIYLLVCRSGNRSGRVLEAMRSLGFTEAYNMLGGMRRWHELGLPMVSGLEQGGLSAP